MITHRRGIDPNLESRKRDIEEIIRKKRENLFELNNLMGNGYEYSFEYYELKLKAGFEFSPALGIRRAWSPAIIRWQ